MLLLLKSNCNNQNDPIKTMDQPYHLSFISWHLHFQSLYKIQMSLSKIDKIDETIHDSGTTDVSDRNLYFFLK